MGIAEITGKGPALPLEVRVGLAREVMARHSNVEVRGFDGLLASFVRDPVAGVLLRGLRAVSDVEYEFQLASRNRHLIPAVATLFPPPATQYGFVSTSLASETYRRAGGVSVFVPASADMSRTAP